MHCFNCGKLIEAEEWQVKFIDEAGKLKFEKCCSEECCSEVANKFCDIHKRRYEDTKYQCFQRLN